jgi:ABC-2 type transport system ATP-binding protein
MSTMPHKDSAPLIQVEGLTKEFRTLRREEGLWGGISALFRPRYQTVRAVDGVSFEIQAGELVGYLGPNGAGKSTTIKMMTGILVPSGGRLSVDGLEPWRERERNALQIGAMFGQRTQLWWDLPLLESFRLLGRLYRLPDALYRRNLNRLVDVLDMAGFLHQPVRQLSLGQRIRGDLAAAMLHQPRILYLDEPTIGLDVVAKQRVRAFIEEMNREEGTTAILTTHDLADVERLCDRILLIDHGKVLFDGGIEELKRRYTPHRVLIVHLGPDPRTNAVPTIAADELPDAQIVAQEAGVVRIRFEPGRIGVHDLISRIGSRYPVTDLSVSGSDLEGVVHRIYSESTQAPVG